ncbi:DUF6725 family protein [uncultured Bifidobacterium sp.]|uniref:DUF6725 family protein n=1 Tax=uncultured Bifidobacterium sp. TaxID=165187 RepID=UPI002631D343|nr:DUF6725 family protein [uncultured Bifidobacterium sp.]
MSRRLPAGSIPKGSRVVVRLYDGIDTRTGRMSYRDVLGHVLSWDGDVLELRRDPSIDFSRPETTIEIAGKDIAIIKPIPERRRMPGHRPLAD